MADNSDNLQAPAEHVECPAESWRQPASVEFSIPGPAAAATPRNADRPAMRAAAERSGEGSSYPLPMSAAPHPCELQRKPSVHHRAKRIPPTRFRSEERRVGKQG